MGVLYSSMTHALKRVRAGGDAIDSNDCSLVQTPTVDRVVMQYAYTNDGTTLCRTALKGADVEGTYGCHYHLYASADPSDSHGTALCWSLEQSALSSLSLLSLCRVANASRKKVALIDDTDDALTLTYTATL